MRQQDKDMSNETAVMQSTYINNVVIGILWKFFIFILSQQVFFVVLLTILCYSAAVLFSFEYSNGIAIVSIIFLREATWGSLCKSRFN